MIKAVTRLPVLALVFYSITAISHVIVLVCNINMFFHNNGAEMLWDVEFTPGF
jgi:hypothetical protein